MIIKIYFFYIAMSLKIEIDCPPLSSRPDVYFKNIIIEAENNSVLSNFAKEYIKNNQDFKPEFTSFGNWGWTIDLKNHKEIGTALEQLFSTKLTEYYNQGCIRYASWNLNLQTTNKSS